MSDLLEVLPDFDIKPYTHLFHSFEKNEITVADLITLDPQQIARKCPLPPRDVEKLATGVIAALQDDVQGGVQKNRKLEDVKTANGEGTGAVAGSASLAERGKVRTLDPVIDQALAGGFQPGHITEIVGESSVGKTQLVLGLLLSVQLRPPRGLGRAAIYVSTEGPLNTHRLTQMLVTHPEYATLAADQAPSLDHVHTIATNDLEAQEHILQYQLPVAIQRYNIGLIVLDSVAANFRAEHEARTPSGLAQRALELGHLGGLLKRVAIEHQVAVVVTNQVSDRFDDSRHPLRSSSPATSSSPAVPGPSVPPEVVKRREETQSLDYQQKFFTGWGNDARENRSQLKNPALGLAWANQISARIVLKMEGDRPHYSGGNIWRDQKKRRTFGVVFAPWAPSTHVPVRYEVGPYGIHAVQEPEKVEPPAAHLDAEHADLLNEELWATDEDDEFP